jgi:hypothetical protein
MQLSQLPAAAANNRAPESQDSGAQSAEEAFNQLTIALECALRQAKDALFTCASLIWDINSTSRRLSDCLYRSTQLEILFEFKQHKLELDGSDNGRALADALATLLDLGQPEQACQCLEAAYKAATGKDFQMPRRIRWDDNDNAVYEF